MGGLQRFQEGYRHQQHAKVSCKTEKLTVNYVQTEEERFIYLSKRSLRSDGIVSNENIALK